MINPNDIVIKPSKNCDLFAIYKISESSFTDSWSFESYINDFENEFTKYFSLVYKNNLVGFLSILVILDEITITNIAIEKFYRGNGFGEKLLNHIFEQFKKYKFFLEVRESNIPAINLYTKFNFVKISKRINYYKNPIEDAIIMKKF